MIDELIREYEMKGYQHGFTGYSVMKSIGEHSKENFLTTVNNRYAIITEVVHVIYCGHGTKSGDLPTADDQVVNLKDLVDQIP